MKMNAEVAVADAEPGEDRLSDLPDDILGHILSLLPTTEAGRAAVLSSRWRDIIASVHTFSFEQPESPFNDCESCYYSMVDEKISRNSYFLNIVTAALLCRRRCARGHDPPLRALRVSFDWDHPWDAVMIDRWLACAMRKELHHLDLRLKTSDEICDRVYRHRSTKRDERMYKQVIDSSEDEDGSDQLPNFISDDDDQENYYETPLKRLDYNLPTRIFTCVGLRTLCLGACMLNLPEALSLPSVETLLLTGAVDSDKIIHRLISGCPRLVDLTLEACNQVHTISVLDKHLHRLALRCCHKLVSVIVDASELRAFEYRGAVPTPSLLTLHGPMKILSCKIDFCGKELAIKGQFVWFKKLLKLFVDTKHLHLQSARLGSGIEDVVFNRFPVFTSLQYLELTGCLPDYTIVDAVTRILEWAPNLEVLCLFILPVSDPEDSDHLDWEHEIKYDRHRVPVVPITCLQERVRKINIMQYQGSKAQRVLVKFLLCNALVLDELSCVFPKGQLTHQTEMINEMKGWVMNKSAKMIFV